MALERIVSMFIQVLVVQHGEGTKDR